MEKLIYPTSTVTAIVKIQLINFNFTHWSVTEKIHDDFVCVYKMWMFIYLSPHEVRWCVFVIYHS